MREKNTRAGEEKAQTWKNSRMVKKSVKEDKEEFIRGICSEVENNRANNKTRAVYEGIRRITQTHASGLGTVKGEDTEPAEV